MSPQQQHGYEARDAEIKPLVVFAIGLAVLIAVVCVSIKWLESYFADGIAANSSVHPMAEAREAPSGPLLQATTADELHQHLSDEAEVLEGYDWVDRANGIVQIPIEQAMQRVVEKGLPFREGGDR